VVWQVDVEGTWRGDEGRLHCTAGSFSRHMISAGAAALRLIPLAWFGCRVHVPVRYLIDDGHTSPSIARHERRMLSHTSALGTHGGSPQPRGQLPGRQAPVVSDGQAALPTARQYSDKLRQAG